MPVSTWVEIDLDRFSRNLEAIRTLDGGSREMLLVVKADAYGHGAVEMARAAADAGVGFFAVATLHEGIQLRQAGVGQPVVVLSPLLPGEIPEAVAHELSPTVGDLEFAAALSAEAVRTGNAVRCHVEIDTGMGRTGLLVAEAPAFLESLVALPGLRLASLYTHFPDADGDSAEFSRTQVRTFLDLLARLESHGIRAPRVHAANSAGALNFPEARLDWLRVGLLAYGVRPPHTPATPPVQPVMSLKSRIVQIRHMPQGASISYARTFVTQRPSRIGVVPVGYGHGYSWLLSNRGTMLVGGVRVPIVGRVTMDLTMVDLEDVPEAAVGDEVVLFGEQSGATIPIEQVAAGSETLPYEIMCTIGKRVARIYVRGGRPVKLSSLVGDRDDWVDQVAEHFRMRAQAVTAARRS
jgi:alanine racemase